MPTTRQMVTRQKMQDTLPSNGTAFTKVKNHRPSDYEERRMKNIADNKTMLAKIMGDLQSWKPKIKKEKSVPKTVPSYSPSSYKRPREFGEEVKRRRNPGRAARPGHLLDGTTRPHTPDSGCGSLFTSSPSKFLVKFPFRRSSVKDEEDGDSDTMSIYDSGTEDDEEDYYWQPAPRHHNTQRFYKEMDEITEEDIAGVAERTSEKVYNTVLGSTCHQCRQKTIDTKTICRNKECYGVKGQFCGPCLKNRYGEDARLALRDSKWICPPCRGICNCSFCRRKSGRGATGILIHLARENGYSDCASYLASFGKKI